MASDLPRIILHRNTHDELADMFNVVPLFAAEKPVEGGKPNKKRHESFLFVENYYT